MKNFMTKSLLCGVIATSFLLANCQKAPNRPVSAGTGDGTAKPATVVVTADCSPEVITLLGQQDVLIKAFKDLETEKVKKDAKGLIIKLSPEDQKLVNDKQAELNEKSEELYAAIRALKSTDQKTPESCNQEIADPADATKKTKKVNAISELQTLQDKAINTSNQWVDVKAPVSEKGLQKDDVIILSKDLVDALNNEANLSNPDKVGAQFILEGKLVDSGADSKAYTDALANVTKTSCVMIDSKAEKSEIKEDAEAKVFNIDDAKVDAKSKRNTVALQLSVKIEGDAVGPMIGLSCNIADGKDAKVEIKKALGELISAKVITTPSAPASGDPSAPASGDPSTPASGDPSAPASGDPSAPVSSDPSAPASGDPSAPASGDPSAPASGDPSAPASGDPSAPVSSDPSAPASGDPSAPVASAAAQQQAETAKAQKAMEILTRAQTRK